MKKTAIAFIEYLKNEKRYSKHTIIAYNKDIDQFINYCSGQYEIQTFGEISHICIRSWIVSLSNEDISTKSINRKISSIRSLFKFLKRKGMINRNPTSKIVAPKVAKRLPNFIRKEELDKLLNLTVKEDDYPINRDLLIVELFYSSGMRRSELIDLKISDVRFSDRLIKVLGKGNKERLIPITPEIKNKIKAYITLRDNSFEMETEYLFLTNAGKKMYPKYVYNIVTRLLGQITSSTKRSPHILRHSFATHLTNNGADINAIKNLLGHANLAATQIYTHNSIEKLKSVYEQSHPKAKRAL